MKVQVSCTHPDFEAIQGTLHSAVEELSKEQLEILLNMVKAAAAGTVEEFTFNQHKEGVRAFVTIPKNLLVDCVFKVTIQDD